MNSPAMIRVGLVFQDVQDIIQDVQDFQDFSSISLLRAYKAMPTTVMKKL